MQFPQLPPSNPFGTVSNYPWIPPCPSDEFSSYPGITSKSPNSQLPAAPAIDVPAQYYSYSYSTADELLYDPQHLAFPDITALDGVYMIVLHRLHRKYSLAVVMQPCLSTGY